MGKDTTGGYARTVERFNERYADQGLQAELLEFPEGSDNQREQAIQRLEAKSPECDVFQADIIWIAEFAQQRWAMDLTEYVEGRADEFIPSTLAPNKYDGRYWGVPQVTGAGLLYHRTDQVAEPPASWQELYRTAAVGLPARSCSLLGRAGHSNFETTQASIDLVGKTFKHGCTRWSLPAPCAFA